MKERLSSFLDTCRAAAGTPCTHTSKLCPIPHNRWFPGTYVIPKDVEGHFWQTYCDAVYHHVYSTLSEKPTGVFPFHADLDLKYSTDHGTQTRIYTSDMLKGIVSAYQQAIQEVVDPSVFHASMLYCIVLQKPRPRAEENMIRDGIHLHFPFFICDAWTQDVLIYEMVLRRVSELRLLDPRRTKLDPAKVFDKDMGKKPWLLYGAFNYKNEHSLPYLYHRWEDVPLEKQYGHAYDGELNEIPMSKIFEQEMEGRDRPLRYYMPQFMSILGHSEPTALHESYAIRRHAELIKRKARIKPRNVHHRKHEDILADLKTIEEGGLMAMLASSRAEHHDSKMEVGWCLFCITDGIPEGLDLWKQFCQRADDYDEIKCEERWSKMVHRGMSMGTLRHWARTDSPDAYNQWRQTQVGQQMMDVICEPRITEGAMAHVAVALYRDRFICSNVKSGIWYEYRGHRWCVLDGAHSLYKILNEDLRRLFVDFRKGFRKTLGELKDVYDNMPLEERKEEEGTLLKVRVAEQQAFVNGCTNAMTFLNQKRPLENTIAMMSHHLLDSRFDIEKDRNKFVMGFENCVLDLKQCRFRNGRPDDKVTMTTGYDVQCLADNPDARLFWKTFYRRQYPNKNRRKYAKRAHAFTMEGGNKFKNLYIMTGPKDSGKSKMIESLELAFGKGEGDAEGYAASLPVQSFTNSTNQKRAGGASPEEYRLINKRFVIANEVTGSMNYGFIKQWSGNDSSFKRTLHDKKGTDNPPLCTMYIQCNELPRCPGHDDATFQRLKVLDHESKFVLPTDLAALPVADTEEERARMKRWAADDTLEESIKEYIPYLLPYLLEKYKKCKGKLVEPPEVIMSNKHYVEDNDAYLQFMDDFLTKCPDDEENMSPYTLKEKVMYADFQLWYRQYYQGQGTKGDIPDLTTFRREMSKAKRMGVYETTGRLGYMRTKRIFVGWCVKVDTEDDAPKNGMTISW